MKKQTGNGNGNGEVFSIQSSVFRRVRRLTDLNTEHRTLNTLSALITVLLLAGTARADRFVAVGGTGDGSGWASPTNSIQGAINAASGGETILVSNGTYSITVDIAVNKAVTICSFGNGVTGGLANAASTILSRGNGRWNFYITAAATVDGFTGTGCSAGDPGGNFYVSAGATVNNCILRNNTGGYSKKGFGGYIVSGVISNCLIYGNYNVDREVYGGGLYMDGGTVVACKIYSNNLLAVNNGTSGGGVCLNNSGAILRNCLIYGNSAQGGGGVHLSAGTVENCTIVSNTVNSAQSRTGGGIYRGGGTVRNCIVYNNTSGDAYKNIAGADANVTYTCTKDPTSTGASCISGDPKFVNPAASDYTLQGSSPCLDVGANQAWMTNATDLAGNPRKVLGGGVNSADPVVDMGAYEYGWQAAPIIKNQPASATTINSATLNGWLVSTGFSDTAVCVLYDTNNDVVSGAWPNTNWFTGVTWTNNSLPSTNLTGLVTDTTYYYTFVASNAAATVAATLPTNVMYLITGGVTVDSSGDNSAQYPSDTGTFTIDRPAGAASAEPLIVSYTTTNGSPTATNGIHYSLSGVGLLTSGTAPTGNVLIAAGATSTTLTLTPLSEVQAAKTAILTLTPGVGNYALGVTIQQTVTLQAAASTVQFWTGAANSQWNNAANWTNSAGPGVIPTNLPYSAVINGGAKQPIILNLASGPYTIASLALGQNVGSTLVFSNGNVDTKILIVTGDVGIGPNGTLQHAAETAQSTALNSETHRLFLNVGGNLTIAAGGKIDVSFKGYAGINDQSYGPGRATAGRRGGGYGGQGSDSAGGGTTYGSVTNPVNNGSAGGKYASQGYPGGGTAVISVGGLLTLSGSILADGYAAAANNGAGSGGSVNIKAGSLAGTGTISANGGYGTGVNGLAGGGGRIAVVLTNADNTAFANLTAIRAYGGVHNGTVQSGAPGAAGTVYLKGTNQTYGTLIVNNNNYVTWTLDNNSCRNANARFTLYQANTNQFDVIITTNRGYLALGANAQLTMAGTVWSCDASSRILVGAGNGQIVAPAWTIPANATLSWTGTSGFSITSDVTVAAGGLLTHEPLKNAATVEDQKLIATIQGSLNVMAGGKIDVSWQGFFQEGPGKGAANTSGGHGGEGGGTGGGTTYGSVTNPVRAGSSGYYHYNGVGGGVVWLRVSGALTNNGTIAADGSGTPSAGGAGGSVNIVAGTLAGTGTVSAIGGVGASSIANGGGGGRIALVLTNADDTAFTKLSISARSIAGTDQAGGAGTVYLKGANQAYGRLIVDTSVSTAKRTLFNSSVTEKTVGDVWLRNNGYLSVSAGETLTVYGSWSNAVATNAFSGGTVVFAGTSPATVWGGNTWSNLTITAAGKQVQFQTNVIQYVYGVPAWSNNVSLLPIQNGYVNNTYWKLFKPSWGATQDVGVVNVQWSDALVNTGATFRAAVGSTVSPVNTRNWTAVNPKGTVILLR